MKICDLFASQMKKPKKIIYHAIEFHPEKIKECEKEMNQLIKDGFHARKTWQTESGLVHEMVKF